MKESQPVFLQMRTYKHFTINELLMSGFTGALVFFSSRFISNKSILTICK